MKTNEIREMGLDEMKKTLAKLFVDLYKVQAALKAGDKKAKPHEPSVIKKQIAQIKTIMKEKQKITN
jgi:ribosomal protein L29